MQAQPAKTKNTSNKNILSSQEFIVYPKILKGQAKIEEEEEEKTAKENKIHLPDD